MAAFKDDDAMAWCKDDGEEKKKWDDEQMVRGEVVTRRHRTLTKEESQKVKDEYVSVEWDEVFPKKPKERLRWLDKALRAARDGRVKVRPVFDIIAHRKFLDGLKGSTASDILNLIRGNLELFTVRQQKQLTSDNFELYRKYAPINVLDSDEDEASAPPLPPPPKVIIEPKGPKKRRVDGENRNDLDSGDSDEDMESKRARLLAKGVERRIDPTDGQAYTLEEFIKEYGGNEQSIPTEWERAAHTAFIFKT